MTRQLLVLHAIRLRGMAPAHAIAARFGLEVADVEEELLDQQAMGRVTWTDFGVSMGWNLTDRGRLAGEQLLAEELDTAGARQDVETAYETFLPLNERLRDVITDWQIRPAAGDPFAANDHRDAPWDAAALAALKSLSASVRPIVTVVATRLPRFAGYEHRFAHAVGRASEGDREWVDGIGIDSCHTVWFELHEDFLATLGRQR